MQTFGAVIFVFHMQCSGTLADNYFLNASFYITADFNMYPSNSSFEANFVTETLKLLRIIPTINDGA